MKEFFGVSIVEILQTGFAGVSILLMYMAYRLMAKTMETEQDIERLKVKRTSIFGFMAFSTLVMAGSLFTFLSDKPDEAIKVNVAFLPKEEKALGMLDFSVAGIPVDVPDAGVLSDFELKNERGITFNLNRMNNRMGNLESNIETLNAIRTSLENVQASLEADKSALEQEKIGLRSQLDLFIKEKAETVLQEQNISLSEAVIEEESGA